MKSICVYAGSASGNKIEFTEKAMELGYAIADKGFSMVYGGGSNGLMGITADAALSKGAKVTGIITEQLDAIEVGHKGLTNLEIVSSMHKRKARMAELSDAIISLPGGVGTWEELLISEDLEVIFNFISNFKKKDGKDWYKRLER